MDIIIGKRYWSHAFRYEETMWTAHRCSAVRNCKSYPNVPQAAPSCVQQRNFFPSQPENIKSEAAPRHDLAMRRASGR